MLPTITGCRNWLQRCTEELEHSHPSYQHDILEPKYMNIGKLESYGALTSGTYTGARKMRRLIVEKNFEVAEALRKDDSDDIHVLEVDCWNHLRNFWLGGMTNPLSTLLCNTLR